MTTRTYDLTLDEALARKFEKIMLDVTEVAQTEDYATDMFLFLREVIIPQFKAFLVEGGYEIAEIKKAVRPKYERCVGANCCERCAGDYCCAGYQDEPRYDDANSD